MHDGSWRRSKTSLSSIPKAADRPHQFYAADTADRAIASADKILAAVTGHYGARNESAILSDESERSGPS